VIVGFSKCGTGSAKPAVTYLISPTNPDGSMRHPPPVVLKGNPEFILRLCDSLPFEKTYKSGVLSFAEGEDVVTPQAQQKIIEDFERIAFAGLEKDQYSILWVKHTHAGGRVELNFLIPRVELTTMRSLNIDPAGQQSRELFDTFRSVWNARLGLADPDDPARAQDMSLPNHLAKLRADASRNGERLKEDSQEAITAAVRREVDAGRIQDRDGVVRFLEAQGLTIPRAGKDYITVLDPEAGGERVRLKGGLYRVEGWNPRGSAPQRRYGVPDPARADELAVKLERLAEARAAYHRQHYGRSNPPQEQQQERPPGPPAPDLGEYLRQTLGEDSIEPAAAGTITPTRRRQQRRRAALVTGQPGKGLHDGPGTPAYRDVAAVFERAR
jgi:hypothetical protein